jgi:hypothetical protein
LTKQGEDQSREDGMGYSALKIEVKNACKILLPNPGS